MSADILRRVLTLATIRLALRQSREDTGLTLDELAKESGIERTTIHKIENVDKHPKLEPSVETVRRLLVAMGLTFSEFFLQIERQTNTDATASTRSAITPRTEDGGSSRTVPAAAVNRDRVAEEALEDITLRLIEALQQLSAARRQAAATGPSRTGRARGDRKSRR